MIAVFGQRTVYDVLAERARWRGPRFLVRQGAVTALAGSTLLAADPATWPLAALLLAVASYSAWGVADALGAGSRHPRVIARIKLALAVLATAGSLLAVTGAGLAAFTGDAPSPKGTCYNTGLNQPIPCRADGSRR